MPRLNKYSSKPSTMLTIWFMLKYAIWVGTSSPALPPPSHKQKLYEFNDALSRENSIVGAEAYDTKPVLESYMEDRSPSRPPKSFCPGPKTFVTTAVNVRPTTHTDEARPKHALFPRPFVAPPPPHASTPLFLLSFPIPFLYIIRVGRKQTSCGLLFLSFRPDVVPRIL